MVNSNQAHSGRGRFFIIAFLGLLLFIGLALGGGPPPADKIPAFSAGVAALAIVLSGVAFLAWHLLLRPLQAGHKEPALNMQRAGRRRLLAALVAISGINLVVGGFWDEVWHRQYGIPFGEDLLWRPHLLIYSSILLISILAFWGLYELIKNGKGSLQQRFRANPIVGLLVLVGGFMLVALPADPAWHLLYGEDISAWSIPHIVLTFSFSLVMILAAAIQMSTQAPRQWLDIRRISPQDLLVVLTYAFTLSVGLQALTTDWDSGSLALLQSRPEWLLPGVILALGAIIGTLANHTLRVVGAATLTGLVALAIRLGLIWTFDYSEISPAAWLAVMGPLLAIDLWYAIRLVRWGRPPAWLSSGLAATAGMASLGYPLVNAFYAYPQIRLDNLPVMLLSGVFLAVGAAWFGQTVGQYLAAENKQPAGSEDQLTRPLLRLVPPLAFISVLVGIFLFVATAAPPF